VGLGVPRNSKFWDGAEWGSVVAGWVGGVRRLFGMNLCHVINDQCFILLGKCVCRLQIVFIYLA